MEKYQEKDKEKSGLSDSRSYVRSLIVLLCMCIYVGQQRGDRDKR